MPFKKRKLIHSFADLSNNVDKSEIDEQPSTDHQQMGNQQDQDQNKASASSKSAHEKGKGIASHVVTEMNVKIYFKNLKVFLLPLENFSTKWEQCFFFTLANGITQGVEKNNVGKIGCQSFLWANIKQQWRGFAY